MFTEKDLGKQVRVRTIHGEVYEGELTDVTYNLAYIVKAGDAEPRKFEWGEMSTVTRIGEFGGD